MKNFTLFAAAASLIGSMFAPQKFKAALKWLSIALAGLFTYDKLIKPNIVTVEGALNNLATGDAPAGYSITEADSDISKIVSLLAIDADWLWDFSYITNDNEPAVVALFEGQTGARNRFLEKRWMIVRGKSMLTELQDELSDTEYDSVVEALKKTP